MNAQTMKGAAKSRLMWLSAALAAVGVVQTQIDVFGMWLTPQMQGLLTVGVSVAVAVLRVLTTLPLEEK